MNARQTKKRLKLQVDKLQSDNNLMRRIIADNHVMQEIYDMYNKPLNCTIAHLQFQEYRSRRFLPPNSDKYIGLIEFFKHELEEELFEGVKDYITFEFDSNCIPQAITASIFVGRK